MGPKVLVSDSTLYMLYVIWNRYERTLVARSNRVVRVIITRLLPAILGTADDVSKKSADVSTSGDGDGIVVLVGKVPVASHGAIIDVLDRKVSHGGADSPEDTVVPAIDLQLLEDGVSGAEAEERKSGGESGGLHDDRQKVKSWIVDDEEQNSIGCQVLSPLSYRLEFGPSSSPGYHRG